MYPYIILVIYLRETFHNVSIVHGRLDYIVCLG